MAALTYPGPRLNSTIVRILEGGRLTLLRSYFALASRLHPALARRHAERLFTTPPRQAGSYPPPVPARRETVSAATGDIALWQAGVANAPAVLLVHGWGGVGRQLGEFVPPLLARGFRVVWFDHPGHGESGHQPVALPDLVDAVEAIEEACGPFAAIIGHSLGAAATGLALRNGMRPQRVAFISAPASLNEYMHSFARQIGITPQVREHLRQRIEQRYGQRFADIDRIEELGTLTVPALFVHDGADRHVPFAHSLRLSRHMARGQLIRTHGLGHFRIVRDPRVIRTIVAFVSGMDAGTPAELPPLPDPAPLY